LESDIASQDDEPEDYVDNEDCGEGTEGDVKCFIDFGEEWGEGKGVIAGHGPCETTSRGVLADDYEILRLLEVSREMAGWLTLIPIQRRAQKTPPPYILPMTSMNQRRYG